MGRRRLLIAAVIAVLVVVPVVLVIAQQRAASAATILSILDGSASVARGTATFAAAADGDIVNTGDRVKTADRSHAVVTFFDGSTLEIEPATTVQIEEAQVAASGAIAIRIAQTIGRTWASVQRLSHADSKFELRTPTLTAAVRGTGFITEVLADGTSSVQTTDGTVQVTAQGQTVNVSAGQTTSAPPNAPPSAPASTLPSNRLRFGLHSPAYLVAVDPFGRACGIVLPGPTVVRQIPGCLASDAGTDPQLVDVPDASVGTYQVYVASIAPGGTFVATASAVDSGGSLTFNFAASGSGQPGDKFVSKIDVSTGLGGVLTANGLGPLTAVERAPIKVVGSPTPRATASGTPDTSLFAPLPGIGFAAGASTPLPALPSATPSVTSAPAVTISPLPTVVVPTPTVTAPRLPPTELPTLAPTVAPTLIPTAPPTPTPTLAPTPTRTPQPTPAPLSPTLTGGTAPAGGALSVLGENWPVGAAVTITWPDGSQIGSADVMTNGQFFTRIRIPQSAVPGLTYKITASGGGLTATADVVVAIVYTPSFTLLNTFPPRSGGSVPFTGKGWPPSSDYTILFDGQPLQPPVGGVTSTTGDLQGSFTVPANTKPAVHTVTATSAGYTVTASLTTQ